MSVRSFTSCRTPPSSCRITPPDEKWPGTRLILPGGAAFTGQVKLVRKATGCERADAPPSGCRFAGYAEPSFPAPFDRISDSQIPLARHFFGITVSAPAAR